ncbi:PQQ-binding-like beta-propeller repeat protein [Streptomyces sp. NPDC002889]|uniref:outer membrane protein assembly factor BamB family protein n=1 Tax=Streptomyces sp. NPDC002889 TaxID=3364669 RepID=UPI0036B821B3
MRPVKRMQPCATAMVWGLLAATALAACSKGGGSLDAESPKAKTSQEAAAEPSRKAFDPPVRFEDARIELSSAAQPSTVSGGAKRPAVTLSGGIAYITTEQGLEAIDTQTGEPRWEAATKHPAEAGGFGSPRAAPLAVEAWTVYAAWERVVKGEGTTPSRPVIEVLAVDTTTGKPSWSAEIPAVPSATGLAANAIGADEVIAPQIIGVDADTVVVAAADTTYAVDRAAGTVRWKKADFRAVALADGVVAGGERLTPLESRLIGYAAGTGKQRWTIRGTGAPASAGPELLTGERGNKQLIVDAASGTVRATLAGSDWQCRHDAESLLLCSTFRSLAGTGITVFDAATVRKLWTLPDGSGRIVPRVTAFWHGAVYGDIGQEPESVILDGKTGKDRETSPGAAPFEVDRYGGLVDRMGPPAFYRATR